MACLLAHRLAALSWSVAALACSTSVAGDGGDPTLGGNDSAEDDDASVTNVTITVGGTVDPDIGDDDTSGGDGTSSATSDGSSGGSETVGAASDTGEPSTESGSTTGDAPPTVDSTAPADLHTGVSGAAVVSVTFTEAMDPDTVTTNTSDTSCSGSIQVSADDFATCVRMMAAPATNNDTTFTVGPSGLLDSATTYRIRVTAEVTDAGGTAMVEDFTTTTGFTIRYFHTIEIDGINDFEAGEAFPTTSPAEHTGYVAWDDSHITFGMQSPDVGSGDGNVWFVVYLGGSAGTTTGVTYNTQTPELPFDAQYHVRWRASADATDPFEWNGVAWDDEPTWTINPGDVYHTGNFVELRVSRIDIGSPATLPVHLGILREQDFNEATWAGVPSGSYTDGYDPDYTQYIELDLDASTLPADYPPSP